MIYLASQSLQRLMLLSRAGVPVTVVPSTADEEEVRVPHPQALALDRARHKAEGAVLPPGATGIVLGADTVVAVGRTIYGKPADDADAWRILTALQGTTHAVHTGHHGRRVVDGRVVAEASAIATTHVTMRSMSAADIAAYLATGEHRGRAGAYAIQETGDSFVTDLSGSWDTVVGLQVAAVARLWCELTDSAWPGSAP